MSNDNRNMILAVVLSVVVLFGWSAITEFWFPTANPPARTESNEQQPQPAAPQAAQPQAGQPQAGQAPGNQVATAAAPVVVRNLDAVLRETAGERIRIETPRLRGSLSLRGARIDDLVMLHHRVGIDANSPPVRLFSPVGTREAYYASFGWSGMPSTNDLSPETTRSGRRAARP